MDQSVQMAECRSWSKLRCLKFKIMFLNCYNLLENLKSNCWLKTILGTPYLPKNSSFHKIYNVIRQAPNISMRIPVNMMHLYNLLSESRFFLAFKILLSWRLKGTSSIVFGNGASSLDDFPPFPWKYFNIYKDWWRLRRTKIY